MSRTKAKSGVKGWCPGAYRPMMSGDGLVVRVRPQFARLKRAQILGLCDLARQYGSGQIDLTSRANLQIRGVSEDGHEAVLQSLAALDLLDVDPAIEGRRNILIPPLWTNGDDSHHITGALVARLGDLPPLPAKMGFAIDAGAALVLQNCSADVRIERAASGGLIARADGVDHGRAVTAETAVEALIEMVQWFVATGGAANRRMSAHVTKVDFPKDWQIEAAAKPENKLVPGASKIGPVLGAAFGQIDAAELASLVERTNAVAIRVTPWRLFILEGVPQVENTHYITDADNPLLSIDACPGAPFCSAATVETRSLARRLAGQFSGQITGPLHISGCAKGCARPRICQTTLVGRDGAFDLVQNGLPWDEPTKTGLALNDLPDTIGDQ